jgi:hypothetical protein
MLFTTDLISLAVKKLVESYSDDSSSKTSTELSEKATKAEIETRVLLSGAKVEQELAIARRIDSAEEVEIEEYYDMSGKGNIGVTTEGSNISAGVGGEGRRVTKRIIKFKGCAPITQQGE